MTLLVIDVQNGITDNRLHNFKGFIENLKMLIETARLNGTEVIYFQHDDGPGTGFSIGDEEFQIYDEVKPLKDEKQYFKTENSCFSNKEFASYLKEKGEDTLIITGLQTNFCIDATIKSAFDNGYKVIVPKGANSTFNNEYMSSVTTYKYYNEWIWPGRFADCIDVDVVIKLMKG